MKTNAQLRAQLSVLKQTLIDDFDDNQTIENLIHRLVTGVDVLILQLYKRIQSSNSALIAVGSYGRRELLLHSDVDIIILHTPTIPHNELQQLQKFISDCWDIGFTLSHQITTVSDIASLAEQDISVISTLLDARMLDGQLPLLEELNYQTHPLHMWSSPAYFSAKIHEQQLRHSRYNESAYNLEPDIKSGPGGLRDFHTILAIAKRHDKVSSLADCLTSGLLIDDEYEIIHHCERYLWRIRFGLHIIANRAEERLLFDYQVQLAKLLNYQDDDKSLSLEKFMQQYFKIIKTMREFNEMIIQLFQEEVIHKQKQRLTPINQYFRLSNDFIEVTNNQVFLNHPHALLDIFIIMAQNPAIKNIRANTIRLIRHSRFLIDDQFRNNNINRLKFIELLRHSHNIYEQLHFMNRHGILGQYLPEFKTIIGRMQYDLFHIFTVDQHTLFVIRNLTQFTQPPSQTRFKLCHEIIQRLLKPELLTIAALFHDIAKGRGGDHSLLGAQDSVLFCQNHQLIEDDCLLVSWLVKNHLLMSKTAQQQDIYDPVIISQFCQSIPKSHYLDYLYCLTVADICATNEKLWNSWKDSLLKELYRASKHHMEQQKLERSEVIKQRKLLAKDLLLKQGIKIDAIDALWLTFKDRYFLLEKSPSIARQSKAILTTKNYPLIMIMPHHSKGSTEVFIYMPHRHDRFIIATTLLSNHHATIQEAHVTTCNNQFDLDTYIILDQHNKAIVDPIKVDALFHALTASLTQKTRLPKIKKKRLSRQQAHFTIETTIAYTEDLSRQQSQLFITTGDKPGLLAIIARVFAKLEIELLNAKIATIGERVEDTFIITNKHLLPLHIDEQKQLTSHLINQLDK